ncbi:MAG: transketolase [Bacillota bacterium]
MNRDLIVNSLRILSCEQIEKANSGHPGLPLGASAIAYSVWNGMNICPNSPKFVNRDRFVLSAGHGSSLNYSLLHIWGFDVTKEDLTKFRQVGSKTAGHPEYNHIAGVEVTTGPLGQGVANAVGMAISEARLAAKFNKDDAKIVDHYTYALTGDGCMMEGIEYEAASLAGSLKLSKLIVLYDKNDITIEGDISTSFTEDVGARHETQGWYVQSVDGMDIDAVEKAIANAKAQDEKPSLIICKTIIGYGSPLAGTEHCHGAPLGKDNFAKTKESLGWTCEPFCVPEEIEEFKISKVEKGEQIEQAWLELFDKYEEKYPEDAKEFEKWQDGDFSDIEDIESIWQFEKPDATRNTSFKVLTELEKYIPSLMGGSADLSPSNKSNMTARSYFAHDNHDGSNMRFGIREHAMSAICNGMAVHGGIMPYCATFFVFVDYMRNAMRMSALMHLPVTYILTHDSIGVGEDGPTHQPIEHLAGLRAIPNMHVFRPADGKETAAAWVSAMNSGYPTCLVLTRQNLPQYENSGKIALNGGYILSDCEGTPDIILMASGSEVEQIIGAKEVLESKGLKARVVSMPCMELFDAQTAEYKASVLPSEVRVRLAVEAGRAMPWYKYVGLDGDTITMETFGESGPAGEVFKKYGFTVENVADKAMALLGK